MSRQTIKRAAFYSTALIVFLLLLSPYILEKIVNFSPVKHKISSFIEQKTGVEIDQDKIDFLFFPQPGVRFKKIDLSFGLVQLEVGAIHVDINILKLIKGQFAVSKILIQTPHIQYTSPKIAQASSAHPFDLRLPKENIAQLFALFPDSQDTLEVKVHDIQSDYFDTMDGSFFVSNSNQTLTGSVAISGLNLGKNQFPEPFFLTQMEIDAIESDEIDLAMKLDGAGTLTGNIRVTSPKILVSKLPETPLVGDVLDVDFLFSQEKLSVVLKPAVLFYPRGRVGINFTDERAGKTITFRGDDIDIAQARKVCLNLMGSDAVVHHLFDILRGGTARDVTVEFKSKTRATLFNGENLFLTGSAQNGWVKIPQTPLIAQGVDGDAILEKGVLRIKARKGQVSNTLIKEGWLDLDLMNYEDIPFTGEFNLHSDLSTLPRVLISLLPGTVLAKELARVEGVVGKTDAVLKLGRESMQKELFVEVRAQNLSLKGNYDRIPLPITITSGSFFYAPEKVVLKDFSGFLKGSFVENLNAVVDFGQTPFFDIRSGPARINLAQIMGWLKSYEPVMALMSPVKNARGELVIDKIKLDGPLFEPGKWQFDMKGSGKNINIGFAQNKQAVKQVIKSLSGSFHLSHEMVDIQGVKGLVEDLSWLAHAMDTPNLTSIALPLKIVETRFKTAKDKAQIQGQLSFPSGPGLSFDLMGKNIESLFPRRLILKDPEISDAMVTLNKDSSRPLLRLEGNLNSKTLEKIVIKESSLYSLLASFTAENPIKIFTDADSKIYIDTDHLDLDSFVTTENRTRKSKNQPLFDHKTVYVTTRQLTYKKMDFSNFDSQINFNNKKTQVLIRNATLCNLNITGSADLYKDKQATTDFSIQSVGNQDLSEVLSCLFKNKNIIDGAYSFTCNLSGRANADIIAHKQNGSLMLNAGNGRIYKWTFLSRLLSVLNILHFADISKRGIGYRTIVIEADIKDSIVYLKKAVIDGDSMALIFSGWIDPLNDNMELTCLVAPFKAIDTIIKNIPVVNTLLGGRLAAFPARATGSLTDPVVTALNPSDVGKGLMNMLEDIIKTPARLLEKIE